ncbi:MAG TPA: branched-chain amino acid ABC transporter substrate-binding protein [Gaiellaceae bacterium]|nr:branched-chain amino acid ABC transporter substrate-binding protein [Gaiellaceae bacterium]
MKKALVLALIVAGVSAASASAVQRSTSPTISASGVAACTSGQIGFLGPLTGPVAFLGAEQGNWAKYSLDRFNAANGTHFRLKQGDTQLNPKLALTVGTKFAADSSLLVTVGPAGSQEVIAVGPLFKRKTLPYISASATNATLTQGKYATFSRVVGSDTAQGRSDALFMVKKLHAKKVVIIDDQEAYSTGLAAAATAVLKANGVKVQRESVNQKVTDFSSLVTKVPSDANVVFLPWQVAANGQLFAEQMLEQAKTAKIFGSDGLDSGDFTAKGAYVSSFARDIHGLPGTAAIIAGYNKKYGKKWSTFGPPSYVSVQVAATAYKAACADGTASRAEIMKNIRAVKIPHSILGITISFDKHGDVPAAKFYVSQIQSDGSHKLVG